MAALATGCAAGTSSGGASTATAPSPTTVVTATPADLAFCASETTRYRSMTGKAAVSQSTDLETYATVGAQTDAGDDTPHSHFFATNGGGTAVAENEMVRAPSNLFKTVQDAMDYALAAFYAEGPGGSHYENLMGPYGHVGCGVYIDSSTITFTQDFR